MKYIVLALVSVFFGYEIISLFRTLKANKQFKALTESCSDDDKANKEKEVK